MKPRYSLQEEQENKKPSRKYCPDCCYYLDGRKEAHEDGGIRYSGEPGTQFHRLSTGSIYQKIGFVTPCTCSAGLAVSEGYSKSSSDDTVNKLRKTEKDCRNMTETQKKIALEFSEMIDMSDRLKAEAA